MDKTLFNPRFGTDLGHQRFRKAVAEHGREYDLDLAPSFRFEREITERQPEHKEQLAAQLENRAPQQQAPWCGSGTHQRDAGRVTAQIPGPDKF